MKKHVLILVLAMGIAPLVVLSQSISAPTYQYSSNVLTSGPFQNATYFEFTNGNLNTGTSTTEHFTIKFDESGSNFPKEYVTLFLLSDGYSPHNFGNGLEMNEIIGYASSFKIKVQLPGNLECSKQQTIKIILQDESDNLKGSFTLTFSMISGLHITGTELLCNQNNEVYYLKDENNNYVNCSWIGNPVPGNNYLVKYGTRLTNNSTNGFLETLTGSVSTGVGCKVTKKIWFGKPNFHFSPPVPGPDYCEHVPQSEEVVWNNGVDIQSITNHTYNDPAPVITGQGYWYGGSLTEANFKGKTGATVGWNLKATNLCGSTTSGGFATFSSSNDCGGFLISDNYDIESELSHSINSTPPSLKFKLSPNPVSAGSRVSLSLDENKDSDLTLDQFFIRIFSIDGKIVQIIEKSYLNNTQFLLNSDIPAGLYMISLSSKTQFFGMEKLIVQ